MTYSASSFRTAATRSLSLTMLAVLAACGGGSGSNPTVDTASLLFGDSTADTVSSALKYGRSPHAGNTTDGPGKGNNTDPTAPTTPTTPTTEPTAPTTPTTDAPTTPTTPTSPTTPTTPTTPTVSTLMPTVDPAKLMRPALGSSTFDLKPTTEIAPDGDGAFRTACNVSHMGYDDPIVYPGQPGRSHLHTFFGNTGTNAASTVDTLRNTGNSTCRGGIANRSGYWVSTMVDTRDGTPLVPDSIGVYYKNGLLDGSVINAIPAGLRMIAGDPGANRPRGDSDPFSYRFKCIGGPNNQNDKYGSEIPNCDVGAGIYQELFFPQCWDGVNLDSPDHQSHMAYTVQGATAPYAHRCPASHPVAIPAITFNVVYTVKEKDAPLRYRLASDNYDRSLPGGYSAHGDWFNAWRTEVSDAFSRYCIKAKKDCHSHLVGDGRTIF